MYNNKYKKDKSLNKFLIGISLLATITIPSNASDYNKYINVGVGSYNSSLIDIEKSTSISTAFGGYKHYGKLLIGLEFQLAYSSLNPSNTPKTSMVSFSTNFKVGRKISSDIDIYGILGAKKESIGSKSEGYGCTYGAGMQYLLSKKWGISVEYTYSKITTNTKKYNPNLIVSSINYYF